MTDYAARIDRLFERLEIGNHVDGIRRRDTDSSVVFDGTLLFLTPDASAGRVAFWASLQGPGQDDARMAAAVANLFNERHFHEDGLSMGVNADGGAAIVGRSVQLEELEEQGLQEVMEQVARVIPMAQSFLDDALQELRAALHKDAREAVGRGTAAMA